MNALLKEAGAQAALLELGLQSPEALEKTALAPLAPALLAAGKGALGWMGRKLGLRALKGVGGKLLSRAGAEGAGKGLWANTGGRALGALSRPLGQAGNRAVQAVGQRIGASPATISKIQGAGKGMARESLGFGLFSGGLEAAMADPGQRGEAFARGLAGGALGGAAWNLGSNVARQGLTRALGSRAGGMQELAKQPWMGKLQPGQSRLKGYGAKALMGGVPFAAGMGASMLPPTFHKDQAQSMTPYAARAAGGLYAQQGVGYNPNLPMPQVG